MARTGVVMKIYVFSVPAAGCRCAPDWPRPDVTRSPPAGRPASTSSASSADIGRREGVTTGVEAGFTDVRSATRALVWGTNFGAACRGEPLVALPRGVNPFGPSALPKVPAEFGPCRPDRREGTTSTLAVPLYSSGQTETTQCPAGPTGQSSTSHDAGGARLQPYLPSRAMRRAAPSRRPAPAPRAPTKQRDSAGPLSGVRLVTPDKTGQ